MTRSRKKWLLFMLAFILVLSGCERKDKGEAKLLIAAAASLKNVMEELQTTYAADHPKVALTFNFAGSGTLEQQIREGAPVDLFISAADKQMKALATDDLILPDTREILLQNELVLIVPKNSTLDITKFEDIQKASIIALGDPASVPAGQYAKEVFNNLKITDQVMSKATFGKDVTEVLTWVASEEANAGVVYTTDALSNKDVKVVATAPEGSHSQIIYPAAVIKSSKNGKAAKDFLDFLKSKEAKSVFRKYGFVTIE